MARRLFTVEDTFLIEVRGLVVLLPSLVPERNELFRVGDAILLKRPDGSSLEWQIGGLELVHASPPQDGVVVVLKGLGKVEVPIGTRSLVSRSRLIPTSFYQRLRP